MDGRHFLFSFEKIRSVECFQKEIPFFLRDLPGDLLENIFLIRIRSRNYSKLKAAYRPGDPDDLADRPGIQVIEVVIVFLFTVKKVPESADPFLSSILTLFGIFKLYIRKHIPDPAFSI